jgi:hypothetical protein
MAIEELIESLSNDIKSENFKFQVVFDRHINEIENQKSQGLTYRRILTLLNETIENKISITHFENMILRAKQKIKIKEGINKEPKKTTTTKVTGESVIENNGLEPKKNDPLECHKKKVNKEKSSLDEWRSKTGISDLTERLVLRLENHEVSPDKLIELKLTSLRLISKHLTELGTKSQYKD